MVASIAGGVGRNDDSEPISGSIACCEWLEHLLLVSGGVQEVSTLRQKQQSSI